MEGRRARSNKELKAGDVLMHRREGNVIQILKVSEDICGYVASKDGKECFVPKYKVEEFNILS